MRKFVRYPILAATHNDTVERSRRYVEDKIEKYTKEYDDCVDDGDFFFGYPVDEAAYKFSKSRMMREMVKALDDGATSLDYAYDDACATAMKMITSRRAIANMYTSHGLAVPDFLFS